MPTQWTCTFQMVATHRFVIDKLAFVYVRLARLGMRRNSQLIYSSFTFSTFTEDKTIIAAADRIYHDSKYFTFPRSSTATRAGPR